MKMHGRGYYRFIYIGVLSLIAAIAIISHLLVNRVIKQQDTLNVVVSLSVDMRTASHAISELSFRFLINAKEERLKTAVLMNESIDRLLTSLEKLTRGGSGEDSRHAYSDNVDAIFFAEPHRLDERVRLYARQARDLLEAPEMILDLRNPNLLAIRNSTSNNLIEAMDALNVLVRQIEDETRESFEKRKTLLVALLVFTLVSLVLIAQFIFRPLFSRIVSQQAELNNLALTDPLTGCHNRRSFLSLSEEELHRVRRYKIETSVMMIDIDHFKQVNDTYGHAVGDMAIQTLVDISLIQIRKTDFLGRLGGEEFAVLLPETSLDHAVTAADKLRHVLAEAKTETGSDPISFTVSIGIAQLNGEDRSIHDALSRADRALYAAKKGGRNRVVSTEDLKDVVFDLDDMRAT